MIFLFVAQTHNIFADKVVSAYCQECAEIFYTEKDAEKDTWGNL